MHETAFEGRLGKIRIQITIKLVASSPLSPFRISCLNSTQHKPGMGTRGQMRTPGKAF